MLAVEGLIRAKEARFGVEGHELGSGMLNSVIYKLDMSAYIEVATHVNLHHHGFIRVGSGLVCAFVTNEQG